MYDFYDKTETNPNNTYVCSFGFVSGACGKIAMSVYVSVKEHLQTYHIGVTNLCCPGACGIIEIFFMYVVREIWNIHKHDALL